jgi:hypothetical protein
MNNKWHFVIKVKNKTGMVYQKPFYVNKDIFPLLEDAQRHIVHVHNEPECPAKDQLLHVRLVRSKNEV